jgi:hypothetical protein
MEPLACVFQQGPVAVMRKHWGLFVGAKFTPFCLTAVTGHTDDIREKLKSNSVVNRYAIQQGGMLFDNSGEALVAGVKRRSEAVSTRELLAH